MAYFYRIYISIKDRFLKCGTFDVIGQFSGMECFARFSRRSLARGASHKEIGNLVMAAKEIREFSD